MFSFDEVFKFVLSDEVFGESDGSSEVSGFSSVLLSVEVLLDESLYGLFIFGDEL